MQEQHSSGVRFAIQGGPFGDAVALRDHARKVEALGYDELFTADHIGDPRRPADVQIVDPFSPLLIAAEATTKLRVGPLVLNTEFYNPALLARTVATVDRLTEGRLVLGLGTGYSAAEHDSIGSPIRPPGERVARMGEVLVVLRSLLDTGAVAFDGRHESVNVADLGVEPLQSSVPILVGGHGERVVRLAGGHADIFQFTGLTHAADGTPSGGGFALADVAERARWLSEAAGDRVVERSALVQFVACSPAAPDAAELAQMFGVDEEVVADSPFLLSGSVEQVIDKVERIRERLGITHFVVRDPEGFAPVVDAFAG